MTSKFLFWASPRIRPFCQPLHCQCLIRKQCLSYGKGLQGGKTFCKLLCIRPAGFSVCWLCLFVSFWESSDWDWMKYTRCERLLLIKPFLCFFYSLENYMDSQQPMLKEKQIIPSVWGRIKSFEHFQTVRVKDRMSLRNGMWIGLRNDIIMRNEIYAEWLKEMN